MAENYLFRSRVTELTPHFVLSVVDRLASLVSASPRVSSEGRMKPGDL